MARKAGENALSVGEKIAALFRSGEAGLITLIAGYAARQLRNRYMERRHARLLYRAEVARAAAQLRKEAEALARERLRQAYIDAWLRIRRIELEALADDIEEFAADMDLELAEAERRATESVQSLRDDLNAQFVEGLRHMRRQMDDVYRRVVEASAEDVTDETVRKGVLDALNSFAKRGVTGFQDRAGRNWGLPEYTEMAVRTAVQRMSLMATIDAMFDQERDLCFTNPHAGSCPLCAPWEGKILSLTGRTPDYPTLQDAMLAGLFHPNCAHVLQVYIPGVSEPKIGRPGLTDRENRKLFLARQQQRYMEREVRRNKRLLAAAIDPEDEKKAKVNIAYWQKRLREHIEKNPRLVRRYDRESVRDMALQDQPEGGIIGGSTKAGGGNVKLVCKIDKSIYSCITKDIITDEVVITEKQVDHSDRHESVFKKYGEFIPKVLGDPEYIFADTRPNSGLVVGSFDDNGNKLQIVLRIHTAADTKDFKNSIITCWKVGESRLRRYVKNRAILYKKENL